VDTLFAGYVVDDLVIRSWLESTLSSIKLGNPGERETRREIHRAADNSRGKSTAHASLANGE